MYVNNFTGVQVHTGFDPSSGITPPPHTHTALSAGPMCERGAHLRVFRLALFN